MSTEAVLNTGMGGAFIAAANPGGFLMSTSELQGLRRNMPGSASNLMNTQKATSGQMSDPLGDIVAGCQRRDGQAQRLLYEHCHERLYRLLVRMVGRQDAPDLLQQVFLQTFLKIGQFRATRGSRHGFIVSPSTSVCSSVDEEVGHITTCQPTNQSIHRAIIPSERSSRSLWSVLWLASPPSCGRSSCLREVEGLAYREIAETLQIKEGTVGSRLNQARTQLRKHLVELGWKSVS